MRHSTNMHGKCWKNPCGNVNKWRNQEVMKNTLFTNTPPTLTGAGHRRTVNTSKGCNQWLSLAKTLLKLALDGGNCSLVARTSKCGWGIRLRYGDGELKGPCNATNLVCPQLRSTLHKWWMFNVDSTLMPYPSSNISLLLSHGAFQWTGIFHTTLDIVGIWAQYDQHLFWSTVCM